MSDSPRQDKAERSTARKAYKQPKLHSYGNIREITRAVGNNGAADGNPISGQHKKHTAL